MNFPPVPPEVKSIAHFLKIAEEHQERNVVVSYWCCMYAVQYAMKSVPGSRPPEVTRLLVAIMDWLEKTKTEHSSVEGIANETTAHALIEEYCLKLFNVAETQDQNEVFDKNTIKLFYTASILMDVLQQFGDLPEDIYEKRKYAKWRAAYIHNCLKNGDQPISGNAKILYTKEDADNFKDFMSKEEYDRLRGIEESDDDDEEVEEEPTFSGVASTPPNEPSEPQAPSQSQKPSHPQTPSQPRTPSQPPTPSQQQPPIWPTPDAPITPSGSASLGPEQMEKAQKYCKWATSALNYDDVNTAITNLQKALHLLQYGKEM